MLVAGHHKIINGNFPKIIIPIDSILIRCTNRLVNLTRFDVAFSAGTLGRYKHIPREGNLKNALQLFGYLDI